MRLFLTILCTSLLYGVRAQDTIGIIDVYGNRSVRAAAIREATRLKEGNRIDFNAIDRSQLIRQLTAIPGVKDATIEIVCCDDKTGGLIVYLGIAESADNLPAYRTAPGKENRLPAPILGTYELYNELMSEAIQKGRNHEDHESGYALMQDSATRIQQLKFVEYARQYDLLLKEVIHSSGNAEHRAIATMVIAYGADKENLVPELLYATQDSDEAVRNNAARALWVLAEYLPEHPEIKVTIPPAPFIKMINALSWTDRNKGSLVLLGLTQQRDPILLNTLKKECLPVLMEMARWHNKGHADPSYIILGRIAGIPDQEIVAAYSGESRDSFLEKMLAKINQ